MNHTIRFLLLIAVFETEGLIGSTATANLVHSFLGIGSAVEGSVTQGGDTRNNAGFVSVFGSGTADDPSRLTAFSNYNPLYDGDWGYAATNHWVRYDLASRPGTPSLVASFDLATTTTNAEDVPYASVGSALSIYSAPGLSPAQQLGLSMNAWLRGGNAVMSLDSSAGVLAITTDSKAQGFFEFRADYLDQTLPLGYSQGGQMKYSTGSTTIAVLEFSHGRITRSWSDGRRYSLPAGGSDANGTTTFAMPVYSPYAVPNRYPDFYKFRAGRAETAYAAVYDPSLADVPEPWTALLVGPVLLVISFRRRAIRSRVNGMS